MASSDLGLQFVFSVLNVNCVKASGMYHLFFLKQNNIFLFKSDELPQQAPLLIRHFCLQYHFSLT